VDAFAQLDWLREVNWCNPPFWMIGILVMFLQQIRGAATVVVPHWGGRPWWNLLFPDGVHLAWFVRSVRVLWRHVGLFSSGEHSGNGRPCKMPGYQFYVMRIDFSDRGAQLDPWCPRCLSPGACPCGETRHLPYMEGLAEALGA
jgi:hypothetical protein